MSTRVAVVLAYAGMCLIWGTTWLGIKIALQYMPPIAGAGVRFVIAGLVLYAVAAAQGQIKPVREVPWKLVLVLAGLMFGLNYVLTYTAETRLSSGLVAVLFGTLPFFMFAFGGLAGETATPRIWLGTFVAFAGVAVISLAGQVRGAPLFALAAITAAASSAIASLYARRHSHHEPLVTLPPAMLLGGLAMLAIGLAAEPVNWARAAQPTSIYAILYLSLIGSCLAFFLNLWVLKYLEAWIVGLTALIIPVIAVAVGIVFGGETFTLRELGGSLLVVAGMSVALTSSKRVASDIADAECEV